MAKRVLVIDDQPEVRSILSTHFRIEGFDVEEADNGQVALELLAIKHIDLIISDIKMPVMDGVDLLREVRKQYPMIRVIMMTGYVTLDNALACMRHGADSCVFKPIEDLDELRREVGISVHILDNWNRKLRELLRMKEGHAGREDAAE